jgi:hypothetical protein
VTTTSVLVPMSTSIDTPGRDPKSTATMSAAVSAPTWLAMTGAPMTRARGPTNRPTWCASRSMRVVGARPSRIAASVVERYGHSPMGDTSSPKNRSRIVVLATMTAS